MLSHERLFGNPPADRNGRSAQEPVIAIVPGGSVQTVGEAQNVFLMMGVIDAGEGRQKGPFAAAGVGYAFVLGGADANQLGTEKVRPVDGAGILVGGFVALSDDSLQEAFTGKLKVEVGGVVAHEPKIIPGGFRGLVVG